MGQFYFGDPSPFDIGVNSHTRELLGWQLSRSGRATTAMSALDQALIARFGTLGRVTTPFLLRSDNGLVFTSRAYTRLARHRRVDPLLQHPSAPPGPRHENPRYGVCSSGLT